MAVAVPEATTWSFVPSTKNQGRSDPLEDSGHEIVACEEQEEAGPARAEAAVLSNHC